MRNTLKYFPFIIILCLTGCASHPTRVPEIIKGTPVQIPKEEGTKKPSTPVAEHWQAKGRFAIKQQNKGANVSFVWQQSPDRSRIKLFGPFGSGAIYINRYPNYVELVEVNGKTTRAQSAEALLQKTTGWQLPISELSNWIQGTRPQAQKTAADFTDQGWHIVYNGSKMQLTRPGISVKLVVTSWQ